MRRTDRDTTALTVLGMLLPGPRHPYEIHLMIERTHRTFVTGLPRSVYHAVERLLAAGLIRVAETTREGARPERTVYRLTGAGEARLRGWVRLLIEEPDANSALFVPALSFAGCLPPGEVAEALRVRHAELSRMEEAARHAIGSLAETLPRVLLIEAEYEANRLRAEREWVFALAGDITAGRLGWSGEPASAADIDRLIGEAAPDD